MRRSGNQRRSASYRSRCAFTLVEVMMVMAALAILAGVVIPQVTTAIDDAKQAAMLRDLRELTVAIERYRMEHGGAAPDLIENETLVQLVGRTDMDGNVGTGPEHVFGPYLPQMPQNQLNQVSRVFRINTAPPSSLSSRVGWVYHPTSGQIWAGLYNGVVTLEAEEETEVP